MGDVLVQLVPLVIGSLMMPTWILLVLFMLRTTHGLANAIAFVGSITLVRLTQGVLFGTILTAYDVHYGTQALRTIVSALLLVTGIVMWVTGLRQVWRQDDRASLSSRLPDMLSALTPLRALGLGVLLVVTSSRAWIFTLTALGVIDRAALSLTQSVVAFLLYVLGAQLMLVAPIIVSVQSSRWLDTVANWLVEHSRLIVVFASFVVGSFFVWSGLSGLIR
ncbi:MAG TPA: GAP family protein [Ktedonobacterales bacterium]